MSMPQGSARRPILNSGDSGVRWTHVGGLGGCSGGPPQLSAKEAAASCSSSRPASGRSPPRPAALAGTVTIAPEADTFVVGEEGLTTTNYGGFDFLDTYGGFTRNCEPWAAPAYGLLRFPLGAIPAGRQLMDARVRLVERASYAQDGDPNHHIVFIANDTWLESGVGGVTWATKPSDGTVAPGDPTLARVPGRRHPSLDVRARLELHPPRRARLQRRPDPARQHGARLPHDSGPQRAQESGPVGT